MNSLLGVGALGTSVHDNPLYVGGCYWDESAAVAQTKDPVAYQGGGETLDDIVGELTFPTNSTSTGGGDGSILDTFTEGTEATLKTIQVAKDFLGGTYVIDVFQNVANPCDIVYDENAPAGFVGTYHGWYLLKSTTPNPVWDAFIEGIAIIIAIAVIVTIVHIVRPGWQ